MENPREDTHQIPLWFYIISLLALVGIGSTVGTYWVPSQVGVNWLQGLEGGTVVGFILWLKFVLP